jgi:hypothetical protein
MAKKKSEVVEDIDLDDISGDKKPLTEVAEDAIEEAIKEIAKKLPRVEATDDWSECLARLKAATDKTWICIPTVVGEKLYLQNVEIENCTGQQFVDWLYLVYPPARNLKDITAETCESLKYRQRLFDEVRQNPNFLRFPKVDNKLPMF